MKKSKEPVYNGPKEGYAAIFLGEGHYPRLRIIYSNNSAEYIFEGPLNIKAVLENKPTGNVYPCWHSPDRDWQDNFTRMKNYDAKFDNKTIFLGYVKDTE